MINYYLAIVKLIIYELQKIRKQYLPIIFIFFAKRDKHKTIKKKQIQTITKDFYEPIKSGNNSDGREVLAR